MRNSRIRVLRVTTLALAIFLALVLAWPAYTSYVWEHTPRQALPVLHANEIEFQLAKAQANCRSGVGNCALIYLSALVNITALIVLQNYLLVIGTLGAALATVIVLLVHEEGVPRIVRRILRRRLALPTVLLAAAGLYLANLLAATYGRNCLPCRSVSPLCFCVRTPDYRLLLGGMILAFGMASILGVKMIRRGGQERRGDTGVRHKKLPQIRGVLAMGIVVIVVVGFLGYYSWTSTAPSCTDNGNGIYTCTTLSSCPSGSFPPAHAITPASNQTHFNVLGFDYVYSQSSGQPSYTAATVSNGSKQTIISTGSVLPTRSVMLGNNTSGTIVADQGRMYGIYALAGGAKLMGCGILLCSGQTCRPETKLNATDMVEKVVYTRTVCLSDYCTYPHTEVTNQIFVTSPIMKQGIRYTYEFYVTDSTGISVVWLVTITRASS